MKVKTLLINVGLLAISICFTPTFAQSPLANLTNLQPFISSTPWAALDSALTQSTYLKATSPKRLMSFGHAIAVSGNTMAVGVPNDSANQDVEQHNGGAVYVFERDSQGEWRQQQKLVPNDGYFNDNFGEVVAIEGNMLVVSAWSADVNKLVSAGKVYLFKRSHDTWVQQSILHNPAPRAEGHFGYPLSFSGNQLAIVSNYDDTKPDESVDSVHVYAQSDTTQQWDLIQTLTPSHLRGRLNVLLAEEYLLLAGRSADTKNPATHIHFYRKIANQWQYQHQVSINDSIYVAKMALSNNTLVISGNQKVYTFSTSDNWKSVIQTRLASPDNLSHHFGQDVAIDNENIVVSGHDQVYLFQPYDNGLMKTWPLSYRITLTELTDEQGSPLSFGLGTSVVFKNNQLFIGATSEGYDGSNENTRSTGAVYALDFSPGASQPVTLPAKPVNISGSWYDPTFNGAGFDFLQTSAGLVVTFYGYKDEDYGVPQWLISDVNTVDLVTGETLGLNLFSGYVGNGGNFLHKPSEGNGVKPWGEMSLQMTSCNTAIAALNGENGTKTLRLQKLAGVRGVECEQISNSAPFAISGSWYDPNFNGSGFTVMETGNGLVAMFYGYKRTIRVLKPCENLCFSAGPVTFEMQAADGQVNWLLTDLISDSPVIQGKTYIVTLYAPGEYGGSFTAPPSKNSGVSAWGTLALTFDSCTQATAVITEHYTNPSTQETTEYEVTHQLQRLASPAGLICVEP